MFKLEIDQSSKKVVANMGKLQIKTRQGLRSALTRAGYLVTDSVKRGISRGGRNGRVYFRGGTRHIASVGGEYAHNWSGTLKRSINSRMKGSDKVEIGSTALHGKFLEDGTRNMESRPNILLGIKSNEGRIKRIIRNETRRRYE